MTDVQIMNSNGRPMTEDGHDNVDFWQNDDLEIRRQMAENDDIWSIATVGEGIQNIAAIAAQSWESAIAEFRMLNGETKAKVFAYMYAKESPDMPYGDIDGVIVAFAIESDESGATTAEYAVELGF